MKSLHLMQLIALTSFAALAVPAQLAAQAPAKYPDYKLIDLGTLGGPHSYGSVNGDGFQLLNNSGVVASFADTALPDPNAAYLCYDSDCFQGRAFRWKDGEIADLGALPVNNNSAAGSINARGWAAASLRHQLSIRSSVSRNIGLLPGSKMTSSTLEHYPAELKAWGFMSTTAGR
jgi:hypothetical protein